MRLNRLYGIFQVVAQSRLEKVLTENIFLSNANKLRELHEAIRVTFDRRSEDYAAWEQACSRFYREYDALAFPGGIEKAFQQLEAGDPETVELVIEFLEADPIYFRSGYHKVDMIRQLCRMPLSQDHKNRLQQVVLYQIRQRDKREFRAYCRLAKAVANEAFYRQVSTLAGPSNGRIPRHARWVLRHLNAGRRTTDR